jgi:hypothetical protein
MIDGWAAGASAAAVDAADAVRETAAIVLSAAVTSLSMKYARTRVTRPDVRYCTQRAVPVHQGLPMRQPDPPASSLPASGASSASGCADRQGPKWPGSAAVRNQTLPGPCQWIPIIVKV